MQEHRGERGARQAERRCEGEGGRVEGGWLNRVAASIPDHLLRAVFPVARQLNDADDAVADFKGEGRASGPGAGA